MRPRFCLLALLLTLAVAVVVGGALVGFFLSTIYDVPSSRLVPQVAGALRILWVPVFEVLLLSAIAGALGWVTLFCLGRDGVHRLEWVALLPRNYGGKSPFSLD